MINRGVFSLAVVVTLVGCSSFFYTGMFKKNDYLVAKDNIYKPRGPVKYNYVKYGRIFKCPITYFRLSHRNDGNFKSPSVKIIRGGLRKKYIVVKLAVYNQPIDAIAYVGCDGSVRTTPAPTTTTGKANVTTTAPNNQTESPDIETTTFGNETTTATENTTGDDTTSDVPDDGSSTTEGTVTGGPATDEDTTTAPTEAPPP